MYPFHKFLNLQTKCLLLSVGMLLLLILVLPQSSTARTIIDMSGKKMTIPDTITKVFAVSPPGTYLLYAIDPHMVAGLNFPLWENEKRFTIKEYEELPVVGGLVGQGRTLNREVLLKIHPDLLLYWAWKDDAINRKFLKSLQPFHIPLVSVRLNSISDYPEALCFLADILHEHERGELLSRYARKTLDEAETIAKRIPQNERVTVYYAEGIDGLATERSNSLHAELIPLAGGINVHQGQEMDHFGMEKISMEQVMLYNPDVILVKERLFYDRIFSDARWKALRAVQNRRVYLIPFIPFNWFDRPPSFMRLLGVKWLLQKLHPDLCSFDMERETRSFYRLFLGVDLSDEDVGKILNQ